MSQPLTEKKKKGKANTVVHAAFPHTDLFGKINSCRSTQNHYEFYYTVRHRKNKFPRDYKHETEGMIMANCCS